MALRCVLCCVALRFGAFVCALCSGSATQRDRVRLALLALALALVLWALACWRWRWFNAVPVPVLKCGVVLCCVGTEGGGRLVN